MAVSVIDELRKCRFSPMAVKALAISVCSTVCLVGLVGGMLDLNIDIPGVDIPDLKDIPDWIEGN